MPEPYYTTANAVRAVLGVDNTALTDPAAIVLIEDAEDVIDELLGGYPIDDITGRKIVAADVDATPFAKLGRATKKLAAVLYRNPELMRRRDWYSQSGPDFSVTGPIGGAIAAEVYIPLNQSGLRRLTGHAVTGRRGRNYDSFFDVRRHDGT